MAKLSEIVASLAKDGFDEVDPSKISVEKLTNTCVRCGQGYRGDFMLTVSHPNMYGGFSMTLCLNRPACRERVREAASEAAGKGERRVSRLEAMVVL